jgi:large repetitive protein
MDGNRFDDLTRSFSQRRSRRHLVKALTGTVAGLAVGLKGRGTHRPFVGSDANAQTPPPCVLTCPANVTQANDPNQCGAVVTYPAPTTTGTCGTVTCSPASGSFFPVGTLPVTCAAQTGPTCTFTVTVNDTQPPSIVTSASITTGNDPDQCGAIVNFPPPTPSDNCPGVVAVCNPPAGSFFSVGSTPVTCTATDASNNTATGTFNVIVSDTQPPTMTCPANFTQATDTGLCSAVVNYSFPTVSDNCSGAITTTCSPPSGSIFLVGDTTVTCMAVDDVNNTSNCTFTVTVEDTEPPVVTCPPDITQDNDPGLCGAVVTYPAPGLSDNCPTVDYVCGPPSGSVFDVGTTTVTCNAIDFVNNPASCTFDVTVNDTENPTVTCPADMVVDAAPGQDTAHVGYVIYGNDNCPGISITCDIETDSFFPVGTTTVTCSNVDNAGNGPVTCTFDVTVNAAAASPTAAPNPTGTSTSGVTTLPSTGSAPSDSSSNLERWGPIALVSGATAYLAARFRKSNKPADESSNGSD